MPNPQDRIYPDGTGMLFPDDLSNNDLAYLRGEVGQYGSATGGRQLSYDLMHGPSAAINRAIGRGNQLNHGSSKWPTEQVNPSVVSEVARLKALHRKADKGVVRTDNFGNVML